MRAYSTNRPISIGTYPRGYRVAGITNFDGRRHVAEIGRDAWGYIDFTDEIPRTELARYELVTAGGGDPRIPSRSVIRSMARDYLGCDWDRFNRKVEAAEREGFNLEALEAALEAELQDLKEPA